MAVENRIIPLSTEVIRPAILHASFPLDEKNHIGVYEYPVFSNPPASYARVDIRLEDDHGRKIEGLTEALVDPTVHVIKAYDSDEAVRESFFQKPFNELAFKEGKVIIMREIDSPLALVSIVHRNSRLQSRGKPHAEQRALAYTNQKLAQLHAEYGIDLIRASFTSVEDYHAWQQYQREQKDPPSRFSRSAEADIIVFPSLPQQDNPSA